MLFMTYEISSGRGSFHRLNCALKYTVYMRTQGSCKAAKKKMWSRVYIRLILTSTRLQEIPDFYDWTPIYPILICIKRSTSASSYKRIAPGCCSTRMEDRGLSNHRTSVQGWANPRGLWGNMMAVRAHDSFISRDNMTSSQPGTRTACF